MLPAAHRLAAAKLAGRVCAEFTGLPRAHSVGRRSRRKKRRTPAMLLRTTVDLHRLRTG